MAKVNNEPGFTNFKKVNILDKFLIQGSPFTSLTFDQITLEDSDGSSQDVIFYDSSPSINTLTIDNTSLNGDINFVTNGTGDVLINGTSVLSSIFDPTSNYTITGSWSWQTELTFDVAGGNTAFEINQTDGTQYLMAASPETDGILFSFGSGGAPSATSYVKWNGVNDQVEIGSAGLILKETPSLYLENLAQTGEWIVANIGAGDEIEIGDSGTSLNLIGTSVNINGSTAITDVLPNGLFLKGRNFADTTDFNLVGVDITDDIWIGDQTQPLFLFGANGHVSVIGGAGGESAIDLLSVGFANFGTLGFAGTTTLLIENLQTNADIDLITDGSGDVLINGQVALTQILANNEFLQGRETTTTAYNLIGISSDDWLELGAGALTNGARFLPSVMRLVPPTSDQYFSAYDSGEAAEQWRIGKSGDTNLSLISFAGNDVVIDVNGVGAAFNVTDDDIGDRLLVSRAGRISGFDTQTSYAFQSLDYNSSANTSSLSIRDGNANTHDVGFNNMTVSSQTTGSVNVFGRADVSTYYECDGSGALTLTIVDPGVTDVGQMIMIANSGSGGATAVTIDDGTITLNWYDGASVTTGNRSLAVGGVATVVRTATNVFTIFGSGLS